MRNHVIAAVFIIEDDGLSGAVLTPYAHFHQTESNIWETASNIAVKEGVFGFELFAYDPNWLTVTFDSKGAYVKCNNKKFLITYFEGM
jgi:hypothetical protein